jgi:hypothetical protein
MQALADKALALLERRHLQGLGGASYLWIAECLKHEPGEVELVLSSDRRFDCIATSMNTWWWSAAALAERGLVGSRRS